MNSPRSTPRPTMPHVVTQWQSEHFPHTENDGRLSTKLEKAASTEYLRPVQISIRRSKRAGGVRPTPSLRLLAARENDRWDYGTPKNNWALSCGGRTPSSTVESVFETYSSDSYASPNSSTHSSFIAELEDTAMATTWSRRSAPPSSNKQVYISPSIMEFKSTELSARAVIKVVDETIAAIEDSNRKLLSRAVAAEKAAKALMMENSELQLQIERCTRKTRPKTAPSSPVSKPRPKWNPNPNDPTPLSVFNSAIDELNHTPRPVKTRSQNAPNRPPPPYPDQHSSLWPKTPFSAPPMSEFIPSAFNNNFAVQQPNPQLSTYHRRGPSLPTTPRPQYRLHPHPEPLSQLQPPQLLLSPFHSPSLQSPTQFPSNPTTPRYDTTYDGTPISSTTRPRNLALSDCQRKDKPLPPLGPMSPSVLSGLVEIGTTNGVDEWGREVRISERETMNVGRRRRVFSGLFRKAKGSPVWK